MKSFITGVFVSLSTLPSFAHEMRNGGNAVVCYTDATKTQLKSIELFDYWEYAQVRPQFGRLDLGPAHLSVREKVDLFIDRVRFFDRVRAAAFQEYANILLTNVNVYMVPQFTGALIDDDTALASPAGNCVKEQFAVQLLNPAPGQRRFQINARLYQSPLATNDVRAGILIHEIIYRLAITNDSHLRSDGTRLMNNVYARSIYEQLDAVEIRDFYRSAHMKFYETAFAVTLPIYGTRVLADRHLAPPTSSFRVYSGFKIKTPRFSLVSADGGLAQASFHLDASKRLATFISASPEGVQGGFGLAELSIPINGALTSVTSEIRPGVNTTPALHVQFYPNGRPMSFDAVSDGILKTSAPLVLTVQGQNYHCQSSSHYLSESGKLVGCDLKMGQPITYLYENQTLRFGCFEQDYVDCSVLFSETGQILRGTPHQSFQGRLKESTRSVRVHAGGLTEFDGSDRVTKATVDFPIATLSSHPLKYTFVGMIKYKAQGLYTVLISHWTFEDDAKFIVENTLPTVRGIAITDHGDTSGSGACFNLAHGSEIRAGDLLIQPPSVTIFGTEPYFDASTNQFATITDSYVRAAQKIECKVSSSTIFSF